MLIGEENATLAPETSKQRYTRISLTMIVFLLLIFSVPIFWLIRGNNPQEKSLIEARNLKKFGLVGLGFKTAALEFIKGNPEMGIDLFNELILNRAFQEQNERAASDQFPLRLLVIKTAKAIDRQIIKISYFPLPDPGIPADMHSGVYVLRDSSFFFYGSSNFDESTKTTIDYRIGNYDYLLRQFPDINFFVFSIERIQHSPINPLFVFFKSADGGQYLKMFMQNKPYELMLGTLEINNINDYFRFFYKTDHHLNNVGAYAAYLGIHEMLKFKFHDITSPQEIEDEIIFSDISFLGSLARSSYYPTQGDVFKVFIFDLPPYKTYENGQEITYSKSVNYLAGKYSTEDYINHYGEYYGYDYAFMEFIFENQTTRNLLVIGDSYDNALLPFIASHYHQTYSVDLRKYHDFSLSNFLLDHPVDDIIIIGEDSVAYSSLEWAINP